MSSTNDEQASTGNTVTIMVGSYLNTDEMITAGVMPSLLGDGNIGFDTLDGTMADATFTGQYGDDLVTQLASAWGGSGSGLQEMGDFTGISSGTVQLTNTTDDPIYVPAQGALLYATDDSIYQTVEAPTDTAWTNGTNQSGSGVYLVAPGQTITVPIQEVVQGSTSTSNAASPIVSSSIAGLSVIQDSPLFSAESDTVSGVQITGSGNYYMTGTSYTPTVTFSPSPGQTAVGQVDKLFVAGGGGLGTAGAGYRVALYVPVEDPNGDIVETINITSVNSVGGITGFTLNGSTTLVTSVPASLSIVQSGASGGTMNGTNFGVSSVVVDNPGTNYSSAPTLTFSSQGASDAASGTAAVVFSAQTTQNSWLAKTTGETDYVSTVYALSGVQITEGGNYYMVGVAYTPTVTFTSSSGETALAHVSELHVAGGGGLGNAGAGYVVAQNVPVKSPNGQIIETINITSVSSAGAITGIEVNASSALVSSVPAALSIVQAGASGGTMDSTNFGVSDVVVDNPGTDYSSKPVATFSSQGAGQTASGTTITNESTQTTVVASDYGSYQYVLPNQGLAPAETYVDVNTSSSWTSSDIASWQSFVQAARSDGILNVAPLLDGTLQSEDASQPFATSSFYAGIREAALYGGGLEIKLPSYDAFSMTPTQWQTVIEEIRWCADNGIRSSLLIVNQGDVAGDPDANFASDSISLMGELATENALPSQMALENDSSTGLGSYYDTDTSDQNSLNAVALDLASNFVLTPSISEDGLEVKGTSSAQTTLIMTGVEPSEVIAATAETGFSPYSAAQVFSEDPSKAVALTVTDTTGLVSLSDSLDGAATGAGGALTFSGTAASATTFLHDLTASVLPAENGVASLKLTLTDYLGQTTAATTSVLLAYVQPTFTSVSETASSVINNTVQAGGFVTFTLATSSAVSVDGNPELVLTNEQVAEYVGQDDAGDLVFSYMVQPGDDTAGLRVRGIDLNGSSITDNYTGLAVDPDSIDRAEIAMVDPLVVNTKTDTITTLMETASSTGVLNAGDEVTFMLATNNPVVMVEGTPTLELNDGGTADYNGLNASGGMEFIYTIPGGGAYSGLAPTLFELNGATITNSLGEAVVSADTMPTPMSDVSYDATNTSSDIDTLVIALSADEYLGDAKATITLDSQQVAVNIDVAAVHGSGETQLITITGNFGSAIDQLGISFSNDLWEGTTTTDRNLYIDGVTLDGVSQLGSTELDQTSTLTTPVAVASLQKLQLWVSEDSSGGNVMFGVDVDGNDLPGTYSTNVANSSGQWQEIDIYGSFGVGAHTVTVTDLSATSGDGSSNGLYVQQIGINGAVQAASSQELTLAGESTAVTLPATNGDLLTLQVSEDAWNGDAQCYVTIDGKVFGGIDTITASHSAGAEQTLTIQMAGLSTGSHTVGLSFINDAWGGTAITDRNLYLDGAQLNGVDQSVSAALIMDGTATFSIGHGSSNVVTIQNITSLITGAAADVRIGAPASAGPSSAIASILGSLNVSQGGVESLPTLFGQT